MLHILAIIACIIFWPLVLEYFMIKAILIGLFMIGLGIYSIMPVLVANTSPNFLAVLALLSPAIMLAGAYSFIYFGSKESK